jgi:hypothetical protein
MKIWKCCDEQEKFFIVYDGGTSDIEWLVCEKHIQDSKFQKHIKEKRAL